MKRSGLTLAVLAIGVPRAVAAPPAIHDLGTLGGTHAFGYAINANSVPPKDGRSTPTAEIAGYGLTAGRFHALLHTGTPGVIRNRPRPRKRPSPSRGKRVRTANQTGEPTMIRSLAGWAIVSLAAASVALADEPVA